MFVAKRRKKEIETFALADENGEIVKTFDINCDPETRLLEYNRTKNKIIAAEKIINEAPNEENYERYGRAVVDMLGVFFGEDAVDEILDFYEGNYSEMLLEVFPFITEIIEPKMREISDRQMAEIKKRRGI